MAAAAVFAELAAQVYDRGGTLRGHLLDLQAGLGPRAGAVGWGRGLGRWGWS